MRLAILLLTLVASVSAVDYDAAIAKVGTSLAASFAKSNETCLLGEGQLINSEALLAIHADIKSMLTGSEAELTPEDAATQAKDLVERLNKTYAKRLKELRDLLSRKGGDVGRLAKLSYRGASYRIVTAISTPAADGMLVTTLTFALPEGADRQRLVVLEAYMKRSGDRCILSQLGELNYVTP